MSFQPLKRDMIPTRWRHVDSNVGINYETDHIVVLHICIYVWMVVRSPENVGRSVNGDNVLMKGPPIIVKVQYKFDWTFPGNV